MKAFSALLLAFMLSCNAHAQYQVGVYYFPGWRDSQNGAPAKEPWQRLKAFKEREPMLGWYDDGAVEVMNRQLGWMHDYGLSYVAFDWYWGGGRPFLEHSLRAYFAAPNRSRVPFALLWANHDQAPTSAADFSAMVQYWIDNYFRRPETFKVDGRPVVFILDHQNLNERARRFDMDVSKLIAKAQEMMRTAGLPPIFFVSGTFTTPRASTFGYDAMSAYNYPGLNRPSQSYAELVADYRKIWQFQAGRHGIPYIVPMTQGWDRRPWGGSKDRGHDFSGGDPATFEEHLRAAREFMDANPSQTRRLGVICCWNEFGEGSYIEPTKANGFTYLEKVRTIFGGGEK
ncbi:glycoside hydrolase family 99-like domain-containing protein [Roseateles cellulosilyticus]|uniref:Glycoside hydrolase family 99-like domain-containing protein n=1 Tax=Pelomonas cellulosilytica TaxID=2906762 RepID=A0ABS8Y0V9_9BURK|nr:glycoside hydrolase family 99-like domain-containing protein [Pelomonas sp. P8]MCE4557827.1 glycoside hydrolase family 99-like domain-containing protein [Pelomonas sp. P8]